MLLDTTKFSLSLLMGVLAVSETWAERTSLITDEGPSVFLAAELEGLSLQQDGSLHPGPVMEAWAELDDPILWSARAWADGRWVVGTGNRSRVLGVAADGTTEPIFQPGQVMARALAVDLEGNLLVATAPRGALFRVSPDGRHEIVFRPDALYLWDVQVLPDGAVLVSTGIPARLFRLPPGFRAGAEPETILRSDQDHLTSIGVGGDGVVWVGSSPGGRIYRVGADGSVFLAVNTGAEEVRQIVPRSDGGVLAATYSATGGRSQPTPAQSGPPGGSGPGAAGESGPGGAPRENGGDRGGPKPPDKDGPERPAPVGRGELWSVSEDGYAEPIWTAPRGGIFSLHLDEAGFWYAGTNDQGRVYRGRGSETWALWTQVRRGGEVSILVPDGVGGGLLVGTSNPGRLYRLSVEPTRRQLVSGVKDARQPTRWGNLRLLGEGLSGTALKAEVRVGNTEVPGALWSDWIAFEDLGGGYFGGRVPGSRYLQYRLSVEAAGATREDWSLRQVVLHHTTPNQSPQISQLRVLPVGFDVMKIDGGPPTFDLEAALRTPEVGRLLNPPPTRTQLRRMAEAGFMTVLWRASDPNEDQLEFSLSIRSSEGAWVLLAAGLRDPVYAFSTRGLPEGLYQVQVTASDRLDNPVLQARSTSRASEWVAIDHTPPVIEVERSSLEEDGWHLALRAEDSMSRLAAAEYTVEGEAPRSLRPENGIFDHGVARFRLVLPPAPSRSEARSVVVVVADEAGNRATRLLLEPVP